MSSRNGIVRLAVVAVVAVVIGVFVGYLIWRPGLTPTMALSTSSVQKGAQYSVTLSGFPASTDIYGWVVNEAVPRTFKAGTTDANGQLTLTGNAPQTAGNWLLCASDVNNDYWAEAVLTVT